MKHLLLVLLWCASTALAQVFPTKPVKIIVPPLFAPAGMPAPLAERLRAATRTALQSAALREKFSHQGAEPTDPSPARLEGLMRADLARWSKLVKEAQLKVD